MEASAEMPRYQCHKKVWALKIMHVEPNDEPTGGTITPHESGYSKFAVSEDYMLKHRPKAGGYFVVYEDGYQSYSPADAFEGGYTRI